MKTIFVSTLTAIIATALLGACAHQAYPGAYGGQQYPATNSYPYQAPYGVVESIQLTQASGSQGSGAGALIGGLIGGLLGNQVGKGSGKTAATVAGAVGGAIAGNEIEKRNGSSPRNQHLVGVRLDNGGYQTLAQDNVSDLQVGSRVRIENNIAYRY